MLPTWLMVESTLWDMTDICRFIFDREFPGFKQSGTA